MRNAHIEVLRHNYLYFWRLVAANGEILSSSEQYSSKWNARRAAKKLSKMTGLVWEDRIPQ